MSTIEQEPEREHDQRPPTVLDASALVEVADRVWVLPDRDRVPHVPNVGIVVGDRATLIVESGIGIRNGERVLEIARGLGGSRRLYATATHFHPEHGYGVQALVEHATVIYNEPQRDELIEKQDIFTKRFSAFTKHLEEALRGVEYVPPDIVYSDRAVLDLGGITAELLHYGPAHTRGDQLIWLPRERVVWTGDLVEERFFCIMPDADTKANRWIAQLEAIEALDPAVVVPGHGAIGDAELVATVKRSLTDIRDEVARLAGGGASVEQMIAAIEPQTLARYPDWGNREWVGRIVERFAREL